GREQPRLKVASVPFTILGSPQKIPREDPMTRVALGAALCVALLAYSAKAQSQAPSWSPPPESERCPSKWGAADERGSANHMKPALVMEAAKLIKTGEVI